MSTPAHYSSNEELRYAIGQLFSVGFHGLTPSSDIKTLIKDHHIGAVVLFQRNVASASQLSKLTYDLQQIAKDAGHRNPLIIAIDQENGLVTRIKPPITTQLPGSMAIGATDSVEMASQVASATGEVLKYVGINMNYAPVADVNSEPKNPVIGVRSFSDNPEKVGGFVSAFTKGLRGSGIIPCAKHFPGHGDTAVDSHYGLPVIAKSRRELEECELVPFRKAVAKGVEAIMTAHISLPDLGDEKPASLSKTAIDILREEMNYDGVVVSDCLEMDGVRAKYGTEKSAVMALKAGSDSLMICHTFTAQVNAIDHVFAAVKSGDLKENDIAIAASRITRIKEAFLQWPSLERPDATILEDMNTRHKALADEVYSRSATIVRSEPNLIPICASQKIIILHPAEALQISGAVQSGEVKTRVPWLSDPTWQELMSSNNNPDFQAEWVPYYEEETKDTQDYPTASNISISEADIIILLTRNAKLNLWQQAMAQKLAAMPQIRSREQKLIVIATCDPYDFLDEAYIRNYVAIYEPTVPAFKAAMDIILGKSPVEKSGSLPVKTSFQE